MIDQTTLEKVLATASAAGADFAAIALSVYLMSIQYRIRPDRVLEERMERGDWINLAAFVLGVSERRLKELNVEPIAQLKSYHVAGVEPRIMGIGPVAAVPKALEKAGLKLNDIGLFELNEAFASQSLAVVRELGIDPDIVNVNGGAIALGHPLGCTGTKLTVQLLNEMRRRKQKYGVVTMCVGTGQGAASVFELLN